MNGKKIGIGLLVIVAVGFLMFSLLPSGDKSEKSGSGVQQAVQKAIGNGPVVTVSGPVGGEKMGFLADEEVQKIMRRKYGVDVHAEKQGSIEMVRGPFDGYDILWPSSSVALEIYNARGGEKKKAENVFSSPIVLYTWDIVCEALIKQKVVEELGESYYAVDMLKLVQMVNDGTTWKDIGLDELYGNVKIVSTHPAKSNSGNMGSGLVANLMNGGKVVDEVAIRGLLPQIKKLYANLGYMEHSSGALFSQFLKQGVGSYPIIVGYENQMIEFGLENSQYMDLLQKKVKTLYPKPTVWSNHPVIALTNNGVKLLDALKDPEIQELAWKKHGFRTGLSGFQNSKMDMMFKGIPENITSVMPMPSYRVMDIIIRELEQQ